MTPKEKAFELILKIETELIDNRVYRGTIKNLALIAVEECIESTKQLIHHYTKGDDKRYADIYLSMSLSVAYLQEVKQEIEKL